MRVTTLGSLPKRNHVAKEAVSAASQTKTRQRSERICKPNNAPRTKPRPCVKTMLVDIELPDRVADEGSAHEAWEKAPTHHKSIHRGQV